jgi:23S rRNA pseudouridine1911/1915/1917 synthase
MQKSVATNPGTLLDTLQDLLPGTSKRTLRQMLVQDRIRVNGIVQRKATHPVQPGNTIEIGSRRTGPKLPDDLEILFEDSAILIVNKPSGLLTAATPDERDKTVFNILRKYLEERDGRQALQIVHRLD